MQPKAIPPRLMVLSRGLCPSPMVKPSFHCLLPGSKARYRVESELCSILWVVSLIVSSSFNMYLVFTRSLPEAARFLQAPHSI